MSITTYNITLHSLRMQRQRALISAAMHDTMALIITICDHTQYTVTYARDIITRNMVTGTLN